MIEYDPNELLKEIAPDSKIKKLVSSRASLNRTALSFVDSIKFLDKKAVSRVALKTIKGYKSRLKKLDAAGQQGVADEVLDDPRQLIQRVQNEVIFQVKEEIKATYSGEEYEWLPSDADEPDPEHQLNYGKIFVVGEGEMPGDRIGCRCGMRILVQQTQLQLD